MTKTTRAQREALKKLFDRTPLKYAFGFADRYIANAVTTWTVANDPDKLAYRDLRNLVHSTTGMDNAIVLPWCGMWLAIEADGYTHS